MAYFVAVVDHGGFAAAGRALGLQKSRLSRRILMLEARLDVRLLNRSSRRFSVTEIGRAYYERCMAMLVEAEAAEQLVAQTHARPCGVIRMSCPIGLLSSQFGALISRFMMENPEVEIRLDATNRRVDVIAEGLDLAIRVRFPPFPSSDLVMRKLDDSTQCLVASPTLLSAPLASPAYLAGLPSMDWSSTGESHAWQLHHEDGRSATVPHRPRLLTDDMGTLREAALAGMGVVQMPTMMIWRDVAEGRLISVLPDWRPPTGLIHAVFPSRRGVLPSVRALLDFMTRACLAQRKDAAGTMHA